MIFINDILHTNRIYVSKHICTVNLQFKLRLTSLSTNNIYEFDVIDEFIRELFFTFTVNLSNIKETGEFKLELLEKCNGVDPELSAEYQVISTDLLKIGNNNIQDKNYINNDKIKYYE